MALHKRGWYSWRRAGSYSSTDTATRMMTSCHLLSISVLGTESYIISNAYETLPGEY